VVGQDFEREGEKQASVESVFAHAEQEEGEDERFGVFVGRPRGLGSGFSWQKRWTSA